MRFLSLLFALVVFSSTASAQCTHNPPCPQDHVMSMGGIHFYSCVSCDGFCQNFRPTTVTAGYDKHPALGCEVAANPCCCNAIDPPVFVINGEQMAGGVYEFELEVYPGDKIELPGGTTNTDKLVAIQVGRVRIKFIYVDQDK